MSETASVSTKSDTQSNSSISSEETIIRTESKDSITEDTGKSTSTSTQQITPQATEELKKVVAEEENGSPENVEDNLKDSDGHFLGKQETGQRPYPQLKYKDSSQLIKEKLDNIKTKMKLTLQEHLLNQPKRKLYHPFVWNSLRPYSDTHEIDYLLALSVSAHRSRHDRGTATHTDGPRKYNNDAKRLSQTGAGRAEDRDVERKL